MRRWHSEIVLLENRHKLEMWKHRNSEITKQAVKFGLQPPPKPCHFERGIGFNRKRKPFDCGKVGCMVCHSEKLLEPRRAREKREWQKEELSR